MQALNDGYLALVARSVGVRSFWLDDCVQEIRLKLWRAGGDACEAPKLVAQSAAIDFQRKITSYHRSAKTSPEVYCFTDVVEDSRIERASCLDLLTAIEPPTDDVMDMREAIHRLPPRRQGLVGALARGESMRVIAAQQGVTEGRISQLVQKTRSQLRAIA